MHMVVAVGDEELGACDGALHKQVLQCGCSAPLPATLGAALTEEPLDSSAPPCMLEL